MFTNKIYKYPILLFLATFLAISCSDNDSNSNMATINGSIKSNNQKALPDGTAVIIGTIEADGTISPIEETKTNAEINGDFSITFDANTAENVVVIAGEGENKTMGFIKTELDNGSTVTLKPIDLESTVETMIYSEVVASNNSEIVSKSDIEIMITAENASEVESNADLQTEFLVAVTEAAKARVQFFKDEVEDNGEEALETIISDINEAQTQLETSLDAATTVQAENEAINVFLEASANAFLSTDVEENDIAQAVGLWATVAINNLESVSEEAQNSVRSNTSIITAIAVNAAVSAEAEASDMSVETINEIEDAGQELNVAVRAALGSESEIVMAFEEFKSDVQTAMENDTSVEAQFIIDFNTELNAFEGAKTIFENAIASALSADVALNLFNEFYTDAQISAESTAGNSNMSEATIEAVSNIVIITNLFS